MTTKKRHNVKVGGIGLKTIVFAHGYGCDQNMWRYVTPAFLERYTVVTFDYLGAGGTPVEDYDFQRYRSLAGYADDVIAIAEDLGLEKAIFVGHSVSSMIGVLAAIKNPEIFSHLILIGPSARYINDENYVGGFERADIDALLESLSSNYLGWSRAMAPVIMGNADRPELAEELSNSFCQMAPEIARNFALATFLSDNRQDLKDVRAKTLILQCSEDVIASEVVGEFVHRQIAGSEFVVMMATGHCPNLSAPAETTAEIQSFLDRHPS